MNESPVFAILERIEELRQFLAKPSELDHFVEQLKCIESMMPKLESLCDISKRLEDVEKELYMFKEHWTIAETAKYLGFSKGRIYKLTCAGILPINKPNERVVFINRDDVYAWIEQNKIKSIAQIEADAEARATKYEMNSHSNNYRG